MGMFDRVHTGTRCGQSKAFGRGLDNLIPGARVDSPDGWYAMHEGGWLVVEGGVLTAWVDDAPANAQRYDSMGRPLEGELPADYRYRAPTREEIAAQIQRRRDLSGNSEPVTDADVKDAWMRKTAASGGFPFECEVCAELLLR